MRVLVTGGRDYLGDVTCLDQLDISILIHGGASGADLRAAAHVESRGIHTVRVNALWDFYDKPAGYKRNHAMTLLLPEYVVAFPGGRGTESMIKLIERLEIPLWRPYG